MDRRSSNARALLGYAATALSAACYGASVVFIKLAYRLGMSSLEILVLQYLFGTALLLGGVGFFARKRLRAGRKNLAKLAIQSLFYLGIWAGFTLALRNNSAAHAVILLYTYPALVFLGSVLVFREQVRFVHLFALSLAVIGTVLASGVTSEQIPVVTATGVFFGLSAAVFYALFCLYGQHILNDVHSLTVTLYVHLFATPLLLIVAHGALGRLTRISFQGAVIVFLLAAVSTVTPMFMCLLGIKLIGARKFSIASTLELPAAGLLAYAILKEPVYGLQMLGVAVLFLSIFTLLWSSFSEQEDQ